MTVTLPFIFYFVYRILKLVLIFVAVCLCISIVKKNQHRRRAAWQQTCMPPPPPPNWVPPQTQPQQQPQPAPPKPPVPRRRFGCLSFLGAMFIIFIIIQGIQNSSHRSHSPKLSEPEKRLQELAQQKREIKKRLETEIPEFVRLLYAQANEIKKELNTATDSAQKDYLMEELTDIAKTFVFLDKEENDYKDITSELSSIERTLVRLKESEKLFGSEYEEFMNQSRDAMAKAKAKMTVKIDLNMDKNTTLNEIQVQEKVTELLK